MISHPGGANADCCSQSGCENELLLKVVDAVLMSAVSSVSFLLEAVGDTKYAWGNLDLLRTSLPQSGIAPVAMWGYQLVSRIIFCEVNFQRF
jgi:hypothetical protein